MAEPTAPPPKKRKKTGGKKKGSRNKATIEREERARLELERVAAVNALERDGEGAVVAVAKTQGMKLAKDVLQDFMGLFAGRAAYYQPWPASAGQNPNENAKEFFVNAKMAVDIAKDLAPYQSPKLSAVMLKGEMVEEIVVSGGLPDDQDGGLVDAPEGGGQQFLAPPGRSPGDDAQAGGGQSQGRAADAARGAEPAVPAEGQAEGGPVRKAVG